MKSDEPVVRKGVYYTTQKQHWLCFLDDYDMNQAYERLQGKNRDAKFVYNHIVCPDLLLYLIKAIEINSDLVKEAEEANRSGKTQMESVGKIRNIVPWSMVYKKLWGDQTHSGMFDPNEKSLWETIKSKFGL